MHEHDVFFGIYCELDPVKVASIVDGWGIDAAVERFSPWSYRAISNAAREGRRIINERKAAEPAKSRQLPRGGVGISPDAVLNPWSIVASHVAISDAIRTVVPVGIRTAAS